MKNGVQQKPILKKHAGKKLQQQTHLKHKEQNTTINNTNKTTHATQKTINQTKHGRKQKH